MVFELKHALNGATDANFFDLLRCGYFDKPIDKESQINELWRNGILGYITKVRRTDTLMLSVGSKEVFNE